MKFTIEFNPQELKAVILNDTLLKIAQSTQKVEAEVKTAATIIKERQMEKANESNVVKEPEPKKEPQTASEETQADVIKIEEIRELTSKAAKKDRQAVKELLSKYDAPNVSSLNEKHFNDYYKDLEELLNA